MQPDQTDGGQAAEQHDPQRDVGPPEPGPGAGVGVGVGQIVLWLDDKPYTVPADPKDIPIAHLNAIEVNVGLTAGAFSEKILDPSVSVLAWSALAWTAKRMAGEFVKWDDFQNDLSTAGFTSMITVLTRELTAQQPADQPSGPTDDEAGDADTSG